MMHPDAQLVLDVLRALCARAGTHPEDDTEAAGRLVCAVLDREVKREPQGSLVCPLNAWVRAAAKVPRALVTESDVILPTELTRLNPSRVSFGRACVRVPLPAAVRRAVALFDSREWQLRGAA